MTDSGSCDPVKWKCTNLKLKTALLAWVREVIRAPLQSTLSVLGVALGVTAIVAVNITNHSARESFLAASNALAESATHSIAGEPSDQLYRELRLKTNHPLQPVVQGRVRLSDINDTSATVYGIDPIAYYRFNIGSNTTPSSSEEVNQLIAEAFSTFVTADTLHQLGVKLGDSVKLRYGRKSHELQITGLIETSTPLQEQSFRLLFLTDIATAQTILGMRGQLSSIQLQLPHGDKVLQEIEDLLPQGTHLEGRINRQRSLTSITDAFQTNLTAMSLLALLVAIFLIYNTMTFLVMRRRPTIEILRALGFSRSGITVCLTLEAAAIGLAASIIGILIGSQLAKLLLVLVERSINNLYFPIEADITILTPTVIFLAVCLGIGSTILAALPALHEAQNLMPSFGTEFRHPPSSARKRVFVFLTSCTGFVVAGVTLMQLYPTSIALGFISINLIVIGYFCLVPLLSQVLGRALRVASKQFFGLRGVLSSRALSMSGGRSSIAICALCVAISATVGVGVMISSFRTAVDDWLSDRLRADVYVSTQDYGGQLSEIEINRLKMIPGVKSVGVAKWDWLQGPDGRSRIFAVDYGEHAFDGYRFKEKTPEVWNRFQSGGIIISEPYAWKHKLSLGDTVEFFSENTVIQIPVVGVFFDYSSDRGVVVIHRDVYVSNFSDNAITTAALFGYPDANLQTLKHEANQSIISPGVRVWTAGGMHGAAMEIFDQTFAITAVLRSLAVIVAIIAVVSILAMIQIDRGRELHIQNAVGFTSREIWASASIEAGVMGLIAGMLSLPVGLLLSWLLIWVVNQRSYGWTMELLIDGTILIEAVLLAIIAALLAGIVPAWWLAHRTPKQSLRVE